MLPKQMAKRFLFAFHEAVKEATNAMEKEEINAPRPSLIRQALDQREGTLTRRHLSILDQKRKDIF